MRWQQRRLVLLVEEAICDSRTSTFHVLVRKDSKLRPHRFVLRGSLFSVAARTERDWLDELTQPNHALPLVVGSPKSMRPYTTPSRHFRPLREKSRTLSSKTWKNAVRAGLKEIAENLGRVRNAYSVKDWKDFQLSKKLSASSLWKEILGEIE